MILRDGELLRGDKFPLSVTVDYFTDNYIVLVIDNIYWEYESVKPQFNEPLLSL